jgi:GT2 family glycosyltransferase
VALGALEAVYVLALLVLAVAFGLWPAALAVLAALRPPAPAPRLADDALPAVAVVVPTLDEAALVDARLDDLARTDYPAGRLRVLVVDGGSRDGTAGRVRTRAGRDGALRLLELPDSRSKSEQIGEALAASAEELVVVTDADVALPPDTVRRLVEALCADPRLAAAGAWVLPQTSLAEERAHWALVNRLWRLEGDALGAALFSGACYALRRKAVDALPPDARADDAHLALALVARGWRVRLLPAAPAFELRVPRSPRELLDYRRRRGAAYLRELRRPPGAHASGRFRVTRALRRLQLEGVPRAAAALALVAPPLLWASPRRGALAAAAVAALAPQGLALLAAAWSVSAPGPARALRALLAGVRLAAFDALALVAVVRRREAAASGRTPP